MAVGGWTLFVVLRVGLHAQYAIPVAGILLGNSIAKVSLGVSAVLVELAEHPGRVEQTLALGATRFEATAPLLRRAMHLALTPLLSTLSVSGIVSIPGMMTGQIMGGTPPVQAARYQILILFAIAAISCASLLAACELAVWAVLDGETHRVKVETLTKQSAGRGVSGMVAEWVRRVRERFSRPRTAEGSYRSLGDDEGDEP